MLVLLTVSPPNSFGIENNDEIEVRLMDRVPKVSPKLVLASLRLTTRKAAIAQNLLLRSKGFKERTMATVDGLGRQADITGEMPGFDDGMARIRELVRIMAESLVNGIMDARAGTGSA